MVMCLKTKVGSTVVFKGEGGYDCQIREASKVFAKDEHLIVEGMQVGDWSSLVKIKGNWYNTVMFENVDPENDPDLDVGQCDPTKVHTYVCTSPDFDHEVIDIVLVYRRRICWVTGFDDIEWEDAEKYATQMAKNLNLPFVGSLELPRDNLPAPELDEVD